MLDGRTGPSTEKVAARKASSTELSTTPCGGQIQKKNDVRGFNFTDISTELRKRISIIKSRVHAETLARSLRILVHNSMTGDNYLRALGVSRGKLG